MPSFRCIFKLQCPNCGTKFPVNVKINSSGKFRLLCDCPKCGRGLETAGTGTVVKKSKKRRQTRK